MRRSRLLLGDEEPGLRLPSLKPGQGRRPKGLVPWWVTAERRANAARTVRRQSRITAAGGGARRRPVLVPVYGRRSVVKASFRRNRSKGAWVRHARYLAREHAQQEHARGLGFDAQRTDRDTVDVVRAWEQRDGLMWSLIVSPEDAERIDLQQHTRDLVMVMERDLGTPLEWVAVDHHNTDNPHVHLLIRGVREDGHILMLDRDYVSRGIREVSRELLERELGPRSEQEYLLARERTIEHAQWTEIDRALVRRAGGDRVIGYAQFQPWSEGSRVRAEQEIARLHYLEKVRLARQIEERTWELAAEHETELRRRQHAHDILKTRARERQRDRGDERDLGR
jgi:type IV secretory pathway VirD2 relaxase